MHAFLLFLLLGLALATGTLRAADPAASAFGSTERDGPTLIGIFYDLKQSQRREPMPEKQYSSVIDDFLVSGLDEALLNRFFRAGRPLYTTQLAIPRMNAGVAPRAFGVEAICKPRYWVIHYRGQVSPPADGAYRFVGNFDDLLVVAINRKVVLNGSRPDTRFPRLNWQAPGDQGPGIPELSLAKYGDWVELKASQPVDIDILIGERPGGWFYGTLLYERRGQTYPLAGGKQILPLFQTAAKPEKNAAYSTDSAPWKCYE
jgi:hypothetical protein